MEPVLYFIPLITARCMLTAEVTALRFRSSTVESVSASKSKCHISCAAMHAEVTAAFLLSFCLSSSCTQAPLQSRIRATHTCTHPLSCATRWRETNALSPSLMFPTIFLVRFVPRISQLSLFFFGVFFFLSQGHQLITFFDKTMAEAQLRDQSQQQLHQRGYNSQNPRRNCPNDCSNYRGSGKTRRAAAEDGWRVDVRSD